jgi:hypothetical protein
MLIHADSCSSNQITAEMEINTQRVCYPEVVAHLYKWRNNVITGIRLTI